MPADLGKLGESLFQVWCDEEAITRNKSGDDRTGWDYIVEMPSNKIFAAEHHPQTFACFFQIKTTKSSPSEAKCKAKVSNWKRLADHPNPAFCIVIGVHSGRAAWAKLLHIDEEVIALIYKRVRELRVEGIAETDFHKRELVVSMQGKSIADLKQLNGCGLLEAIYSFVADPLLYSEHKQNIKSQVGFENGHTRINMLLDSGLYHLANWVTGWEKQLEAKVVSMQETRFGIDIELPKNASELSSTFSILDRPADGKAVIRCENQDGSRTVELPVEYFYSNSVLPELPKEHMTIRLANRLIEARISGDPRRPIDFRFDFSPASTGVSLEEGGAAARFVRMIMAETCTIIFQIGSVRQYVTSDPTAARVPKILEPLIQALDQLADIAPLVGLPGHTVVQAHALLHKADQVRVAHALLMGHLEFDVSMRRDDSVTQPVIATPIIASFPFIPGRGVVIAAVLIGPWISRGLDRIGISHPRCEIVRRRIVEGNIPAEQFAEEYIRPIVKRFESSDIPLFLSEEHQKILKLQ